MNKNHRRRWIVASTVCACLVAGTAHGQYYYGGIDLTWNDCGATGLKNLSSPCGTDTSALKLYGSFVAPPGLNAIGGYRISVGAQDVGLTPWWDYSVGGCREGLWSLKANAPGASCAPVAFGLATDPTFTKLAGEYGGRANVYFGASVTFLDPQDIAEGETFYAFTLTLRRPAPSVCDGCCVPTCLLATLEFYPASGGVIVMEGDFNGAAGWQGGFCTTRPGTSAISAGCLPTPTKTSTWGSIKTLYR